MPLLCQHCSNPPCADVCPTRATFRRADGIVLVDRHRCIGCRYCVMACPFNVRFFVPEHVRDQRPSSPRGKGTAEGCTLCVHRLDQGRLPACVEACSAGAMIFGDLNDPESPVRKALDLQPATRLRNDLRLAQGVLYRGL
jgi:molybdopterin-containing oxidoreductase family iron-sulfur binding subunit